MWFKVTCVVLLFYVKYIHSFGQRAKGKMTHVLDRFNKQL
jgi:hypothetical protein